MDALRTCFKQFLNVGILIECATRRVMISGQNSTTGAIKIVLLTVDDSACTVTSFMPNIIIQREFDIFQLLLIPFCWIRWLTKRTLELYNSPANYINSLLDLLLLNCY